MEAKELKQLRKTAKEELNNTFAKFINYLKTTQKTQFSTTELKHIIEYTEPGKALSAAYSKHNDLRQGRGGGWDLTSYNDRFVRNLQNLTDQYNIPYTKVRFEKGENNRYIFSI